MAESGKYSWMVNAQQFSFYLGRQHDRRGPERAGLKALYRRFLKAYVNIRTPFYLLVSLVQQERYWYRDLLIVLAPGQGRSLVVHFGVFHEYIGHL